MKFAEYKYLWFLIPVGLVIGFLIRAYVIRRAEVKILGDDKLLKKLSSSASPFLGKVKILILSLAMTLIVLSMAGPQWGYQIEEIKTRGVDIMVLLDVSRSMLAEDIKPNRLEWAKTKIRRLLSMLKGDRIGLVVFSGASVLQCPLTSDYSVYNLFLQDVNTEMVSHGGTDIGKSINTAIKSFEGSESKYHVLLLITDGEDHGKHTEEAVRNMKNSGIRLYMMGVGTLEGGLIPVVKEDGTKSFLKDKNGNFINTKLEKAAFAKIAAITGSGAYVKAVPGDEDLMEIYRNGIAQLEEREIKSSTVKKYENRYQIVFSAALVLLILESLIEERKKEVEY
ncbi:MAG: VWA domain-containing protein [bacterium]|nr:VWA domain-containing protein [bacterium]